MSKDNWRDNVKNPSNQGFNINGNHTKKQGWWRNGGTANKTDKKTPR